MNFWLAQWIVRLSLAYASAGLVFALWFVAFRLTRFDAAAQDAGWGLRCLLFPGIAACWPWFALRLKRQMQK